MIGKTNVSGGGSSSGGSITVIAPYGATVTISKDGVSKNKVVSGTDVTFTGLSSGVWTVYTEYNTQTDSRTVNVTLDYETTASFFSSTITINYPEGSTCSVSDGVTTLNAPDTSGTYNCEVPNAGTWTITCVKGAQNAEYNVEITESGESKTVTITYTTYLINGGNLCVSTTGGWSSIAMRASANSSTTTPTYTVNGDSIIFSAKGGGNTGSYYGFVFRTTNKIDLTNFSTLSFTGTYGGGYTWYFTIWSSMGTYSTDNIIKKTTENSIDVSSLTGSYFIGFYSEAVGSDTLSLTVSNMKLV